MAILADDTIIPMAIRKIVYLPDPVLQQKAELVEKFDAELKTLISDMVETMYAAKGVGLAAPQIGISKRVAVIDVSETNDQPIELVNPEFIVKEGKEKMSAGCLSVPGAYDAVDRASHVIVKAFDRNGKEFTIEAEGDLLCHALQHEIDHLDGILFIDRLSSLKRNRQKKRFNKYMRTVRKS